MIELKCYCLSERKEDEIDLEVFKSISTQQFKDNYAFLKEKKVDINVYFYDEDKKPFIENDLVQGILAKEGTIHFPLVIMNGKLVKSGQLLSVKEIEDILDIGISLQVADYEE
ncbi:arsenic metallochaperone ArsD family protein [Listeria innocua]|uniref:arsenic metallochaperone ArsD family protein n=1 Tax=Listeria innocua TaxID=1642 RepID=UPI00162A1488|nr:arsenic metallochaperone ArsD family protein [Listeria innocua]MBC1385645.1 arsenic metallochaperone ArsD family protein [Listeria innocua]